MSEQFSRRDLKPMAFLVLLKIVDSFCMFHIFFINGIFKTQKLKSSLEASFVYFIKDYTQVFVTQYLF